MRSIIAGLSIATVTSISWTEATTIDQNQPSLTSESNLINKQNSTNRESSTDCVNTVTQINSDLWLQKITNFLLPKLPFSNCQTRSPFTERYNSNSYHWQDNLNPRSNSISIAPSSQTTASLLSSINPECIAARQQWQPPVQTAKPSKSVFNYSRPKPKNTASASETPPKFPTLSRSSLIVSLPQDSSFIPKDTKFANPAPETERIASPFGWRRRPYSNQLQFHQGIDYGAPYGSPVVAVGNGIVTRVISGCADFGNIFCGGQMGNWIEVDHGNGAIAVYGHLKNSSIAIKEGMKVWRNQNIAQVGSSGWSTGAHLDFRLKIAGEYEDPASYVMSVD